MKIHFYTDIHKIHTLLCPHDISHPFIKMIHREWKKATTKHKSYTVKNQFHQEQRIDEWSNELKTIDSDFRNRNVEDAVKDMDTRGSGTHRYGTGRNRDASVSKPRKNARRGKLMRSRQNSVCCSYTHFKENLGEQLELIYLGASSLFMRAMRTSHIPLAR